jgi:simple sugar transport system permease protein
MLPYFATILVLLFITRRKKKEYQAPGALGAAYFREDR